MFVNFTKAIWLLGLLFTECLDQDQIDRGMSMMHKLKQKTI